MKIIIIISVIIIRFTDTRFVQMQLPTRFFFHNSRQSNPTAGISLEFSTLSIWRVWTFWKGHVLRPSIRRQSIRNDRAVFFPRYNQLSEQSISGRIVITSSVLGSDRWNVQLDSAEALSLTKMDVSIMKSIFSRRQFFYLVSMSGATRHYLTFIAACSLQSPDTGLLLFQYSQIPIQIKENYVETPMEQNNRSSTYEQSKQTDK